MSYDIFGVEFDANLQPVKAGLGHNCFPMLFTANVATVHERGGKFSADWAELVLCWVPSRVLRCEAEHGEAVFGMFPNSDELVLFCFSPNGAQTFLSPRLGANDPDAAAGINPCGWKMPEAVKAGISKWIAWQ